jgi:predicted alpha/beta-hydrolase family hydrolase
VATPLPKPVTITVSPDTQVSGLFSRPRNARACLVLAHGAGAGMSHPFMSAMAESLSNHGVATLRFQFPYSERGSKRPDSPVLCHSTIRAAVAKARKLAPYLPLFAGGKSFGGRMTSQAQADQPLPRVVGLIFLGFPLHPANRPSTDRAEHLFAIKIPLLFLQGTRDALAEPRLLKPLTKRLKTATLKLYQHADHSFHVPARSGTTDDEVRGQMTEAITVWIDDLRPTPQ